MTKLVCRHERKAAELPRVSVRIENQREEDEFSRWAALKRGWPRSSPEPGSPGTGNIHACDGVRLSMLHAAMIASLRERSRAAPSEKQGGVTRA